MLEDAGMPLTVIGDKGIRADAKAIRVARWVELQRKLGGVPSRVRGPITKI